MATIVKISSEHEYAGDPINITASIGSNGNCDANLPNAVKSLHQINIANNSILPRLSS